MLELINFLHFLGLAWGLGGATIAFIISRKTEKNPEISPATMKIIPSISKLIFAGLILLIISGIALPFYISWPLNKNLLIIKHVFVAWIFIIGMLLVFKMKKLSKYAPKPKEKPSLQFLQAKKQMKILSTMNFFLWYIVTFLSAFV